LTLARALELLDRQSPDLAEQRARIEQADAVARQALAAILPVVSATGSYRHDSAEARLDTPAGSLVLQPRDAFTASARVLVPLFAQNAYWDIARARELGTAQRASFEAGRQQLRGALVRACWLVQSARSIVRVAEQGVTSALEHYESTRRAAEAGTATRLAVLQAQSALARRRGSLTEARAGVDRGELALGALLGRAEPVRVDLPPFQEDAGNPAAGSALVQGSLAARKESAQRSAELRASEHAVTSSTLRFLPALSGSFEAFASDQPYLTGDRQGWRAGLELTWTLYDGGYRYGKRSEALAEQAGARAVAEATRLEIAKQVQDAVLDLQVARDRVHAAREESLAADETASAAQRSFSAGQASSLDVIDALDRSIQAAVGLETAQADLGLAQAALRTARGIAW